MNVYWFPHTIYCRLVGTKKHTWLLVCCCLFCRRAGWRERKLLVSFFQSQSYSIVCNWFSFFLSFISSKSKSTSRTGLKDINDIYTAYRIKEKKTGIGLQNKKFKPQFKK